MQSSTKAYVFKSPYPYVPLCAQYQHSSPSCNLFQLPKIALLLLSKPCGFIILTSSMVSSTLSKLLMSLNLNPASQHFHSFRRSGVWAAYHGVTLDALKAQEASSAIHVYLKNTPKIAASVAHAFK